MKLRQLSITEAQEIHYKFTHEIKDFLLYTRWFIKYQIFDALEDAEDVVDSYGRSIMVIKTIYTRLVRYQEIMQSDATAFAYLLFQPSSKKFITKCLLRFVEHSDCSLEFKRYTINIKI